MSVIIDIYKPAFHVLPLQCQVISELYVINKMHLPLNVKTFPN